MSTYAVMIDGDAEFTQFIAVMKATSDPSVDGNWSNVGANINVGGINKARKIKSLWVFEDGSDLHVATQSDDGKVAYHVFDPGTDAWTTSDENVVTNNPPGGNHACSIALRSDGDRIIAYAGNDGGDDAIFYARNEASSWTTNVQVDGAATTDDYTGVVIVRGLSDRMHFFYKNDTDNDALHRSLSSANSLDTADQTVDATAATGQNLLFSPGVSYVSGATKVRAVYLDFGNKSSIVELDSGADPSFATQVNITDDGTIVNGQLLLCLAVDGTTIHLLYSESNTGDIFHDENDDDGGWGTDDEEKDAVTCNRISCNVYTRGSKVLAYLYLDVATVKYDERTLIPAGTITPPIGSAVLTGAGGIMDLGLIVPTEV